METFKVILNDEEENGVFAISHVLDPAIEAMYVFMGNEKDVEIKLATVSDEKRIVVGPVLIPCLLYTSDAADEEDSVDLGGRRIIKKKK